jgi:hypothetical protein
LQTVQLQSIPNKCIQQEQKTPNLLPPPLRSLNLLQPNPSSNTPPTHLPLSQLRRITAGMEVNIHSRARCAASEYRFRQSEFLDRSIDEVGGIRAVRVAGAVYCLARRLRASNIKPHVPPRAILCRSPCSAVHETDVIVYHTVTRCVLELCLLSSHQLIGPRDFEYHATVCRRAFGLGVDCAGGDVDCGAGIAFFDGPDPDVVVAAIGEDGVPAYLAGFNRVVAFAFTIHTWSVCSSSVGLSVATVDLVLRTFVVMRVPVACVHLNLMALPIPISEVGATFFPRLLAMVALVFSIYTRGLCTVDLSVATVHLTLSAFVVVHVPMAVIHLILMNRTFSITLLMAMMDGFLTPLHIMVSVCAVEFSGATMQFPLDAVFTFAVLGLGFVEVGTVGLTVVVRPVGCVLLDCAVVFDRDEVPVCGSGGVKLDEEVFAVGLLDMCAA